MPEITNLDDLVKTPHADVFERVSPRTVRLKLQAGQQLPPHKHPDTDIVLHLLDDELDLSLNDDVYALAPGDLICFSGESDISPYALDDCVAIVVFAPTAE